MKKTLIWVVGLVVVVVVVIILATGGGEKKAGAGAGQPGEEMTAMDLKAGEILYSSVETEFSKAQTAYVLQDMLQSFPGMTLVGYAWVASVQPGQGGSWQVELDVDPPDQKKGGAEIVATTVAEQGQAACPTVGDKVRFEGIIATIDLSGQRPRLFITRAHLTAATAKKK